MATSNITAKTFPGVYTQIIDRSFLLPQTSRFRCGLVGVARKGPFDTPTAISSLSEFITTFGQPLDGQYYLANAVAILSDLTDGIKVVRVGRKPLSNTGAQFYSATAESVGTISTYPKALVVSPTVQANSVYVTVKQAGKPSTINALVASVGTATTNATLTSAGTVRFSMSAGDDFPIKAVYDSLSTVQYSVGAPAANEAESILYAPTYGSNANDYEDQPLYGGPLALTCTGSKGAFEFQLTAACIPQYAALQPGDLLKLKQPYRATTWEVRVKQSLPDGRVLLEPSDRTDLGYQASSLQDTYDSATIHRKTGQVPHLFLQAASAGDWANGSDQVTGLYVKVRPGGVPGTKKFEVYENGALKETIDGLYDGAGTNSYNSRLTDRSAYIAVVHTFSGSSADATTKLIAGNASYGWAAGAQQLINAGVASSGGSFNGGYNGEAATAQDFVGEFDVAEERFTGIQSFTDTDNMKVDVLCCPGITDATPGATATDSYEPFSTSQQDTTGVHRKLDEVAKFINAKALIDVPPGLNARAAIDWHNGAGLYSGRGRINSANVACYWNWFTITDPFTQQDKSVPPTLGVLRCLAFTFDRDKPWYAASGDIRGLIPEAKSVEFERVSEDTKQAMYGNGQSVNGIFLDRGEIKLWGERTMQVAESKLSVVHNVILVNYVVNNMAEIGRRFLFEPNDPELLVRMRLAYTQFLDKVVTERGMEEYNLVMDDSNNNAETRNRREVIVDLAMIPTDSVERIYITATVYSSGAKINNLTSD
jgi:phage tail sheath protein FI